MNYQERADQDTLYESVVELTTEKSAEQVVAAVYPGNEGYFNQTLQVPTEESFITLIENMRKAPMKASEYMVEKMVKSIFKLTKRMTKDNKEAFVREHYKSNFSMAS